MDRFKELANRLKDEFGYSTCFLCDRAGDSLILSYEDSSNSFDGFLRARLKEKDNAYFSEVRFFRYRNEQEKAQQHLALIPIDLEPIPFAFLGVVYSSIEAMDQLLKMRILPAYLTHWMKTLVIEQNLHGVDEHVQQLVTALEEKRQYTNALESKVEDLKKRVQEVQALKGGKDVEIFALRELLETQVVDYQALAKQYRTLFSDYEKLEKEYLTSVVQFETQFHLAKKRKEGGLQSELEMVLLKQKGMEKELAQAKAVSAHYKRKYVQILSNFSKWSPDQLQDFQKKVRELGGKSGKKSI